MSIEEDPCAPGPGRVLGPDDPVPAGRIAGERSYDYLRFEELPATATNLAQLELSAGHDVPVVDGVEIDLAEERDER